MALFLCFTGLKVTSGFLHGLERFSISSGRRIFYSLNSIDSCILSNSRNHIYLGFNFIFFLIVSALEFMTGFPSSGYSPLEYLPSSLSPVLYYGLSLISMSYGEYGSSFAGSSITLPLCAYYTRLTYDSEIGSIFGILMQGNSK